MSATNQISNAYNDYVICSSQHKILLDAMHFIAEQHSLESLNDRKSWELRELHVDFRLAIPKKMSFSLVSFFRFFYKSID